MVEHLLKKCPQPYLRTKTEAHDMDLKPRLASLNHYHGFPLCIYDI